MSVLIYVKKNTRLHILFVTTKHINLELKLRCEIVKSVIKDWKKFLHSVTIDFYTEPCAIIRGSNSTIFIFDSLLHRSLL